MERIKFVFLCLLPRHQPRQPLALSRTLAPEPEEQVAGAGAGSSVGAGPAQGVIVV